MRCKGTIYFLEQRTKNKEIYVRSYCYWFISRQVHNKPTLPENGLSRDSSSAFCHISPETIFQKAKRKVRQTYLKHSRNLDMQIYHKEHFKIYHNMSSTNSRYAILCNGKSMKKNPNLPSKSGLFPYVIYFCIYVTSFSARYLPSSSSSLEQLTKPSPNTKPSNNAIFFFYFLFAIKFFFRLQMYTKFLKPPNAST